MLSPQDDNIFAPHPYQYMKGIKKTDPNYLGSLVTGVEFAAETALYSSIKLINKASMGMINITNKVDIQDKMLKTNPFSLLDKRLDINKYENNFNLTGQTIWQILHECTLRHPGYIYGARPYGNSLEYRVFFGVPSQRYFSKKITNAEIRKLNAIYTSLMSITTDKVLSTEILQTIFPGEVTRRIALENNQSFLSHAARGQLTAKACEYYLEKTRDRFIPFRQFHLISSDRNLIGNNIIVSSHNMTNAVSVNFIKSSKDEKKNVPGAENLDRSTIRFRANQNIGPATKIEKTITEQNCIGPANALRYGLGELLYGTRKMYEGSLTILGNTKINPWDVVILHDNITNMYGPLEVCSITHMFSFETGFITDIEVNALVTANEELTLPVVSQSIIYETRSRVFDEYNNLYALGNDKDKRKAAVEEIVREELEDLIEEEVGKDAGFLRKHLGPGFSIGTSSASDEKKDEFIKSVTKTIMERYIENEGTPSFLNEIVRPNAKIPKELTDIIGGAGAFAAVGTGTILGGELLRRAFTGRRGLQLLGGGWKAGIFFAGSILLANSGNTINDAISTSLNSGVLGKNLFRQQILSRMEAGTLIQLFPLIKDGLPLVTGGFEEVDESEKWNNMLGYIFNTTSSAVQGYLKRQTELKSFGKDIITAYDAGELKSLKSDVVVNLAKLGKNIGFPEDSTNTLLAYIYED